MSKYNTIGLIAEDMSDVETLKVLIPRIAAGKKIGFKHFVGQGCGKLKRKADAWAQQLKTRGCNILVLVHDRDRHNVDGLYNTINGSLSPYAIKKTFISIPIEEMEAWFLADSKAIKDALNLPKAIAIFHHPETVPSPKEELGRQIEKASKKEKIYLNTEHNPKIANHVNLDTLAAKSESFSKLSAFIKSNI